MRQLKPGTAIAGCAMVAAASVMPAAVSLAMPTAAAAVPYANTTSSMKLDCETAGYYHGLDEGAWVGSEGTGTPPETKEAPAECQNDASYNTGYHEGWSEGYESEGGEE